MSRRIATTPALNTLQHAAPTAENIDTSEIHAIAVELKPCKQPKPPWRVQGKPDERELLISSRSTGESMLRSTDPSAIN